MFWIIIGSVIAVLLVGGWLWDRRHGFTTSRMDGHGSDNDRAQADRYNSQRYSDGGMGGA